MIFLKSGTLHYPDSVLFSEGQCKLACIATIFFRLSRLSGVIAFRLWVPTSILLRGLTFLKRLNVPGVVTNLVRGSTTSTLKNRGATLKKGSGFRLMPVKNAVLVSTFRYKSLAVPRAQYCKANQADERHIRMRLAFLVWRLFGCALRYLLL